jgi:hypothetical protein
MIKDFMFEAHYYSSGLKFLPFGERPSWVPAADTIIISQDTGISIQEGDYVLGLARFKHNEETIFWVGLSEKSIDQVYGDRGGNYHGIGIWLRDSLVLNSEDLAEIIQKLLIHRSSVKDWKSMGVAAEKAVNHIKLAGLRDLPAEFKEGRDGRSFGQGHFNKAALWHVEVDNYDLEFHTQVGSLISLFQLINHNFEDFSKLFAVVSKNPVSAYGSVEFSNTLKPFTYDLNEEKVKMILELAQKNIGIEKIPNANVAPPNKKTEKIDQNISDKNDDFHNHITDFGAEAVLATKIEIFKNDLRKINQNTVHIGNYVNSLEKRIFVYFLVLLLVFLSILTFSFLNFLNLKEVAAAQSTEMAAQGVKVVGSNDEVAFDSVALPIKQETPTILTNGKYYSNCGDGKHKLELVGNGLSYEDTKFSKISKNGSDKAETWESNGKTLKISSLSENKIRVEFEDDMLAGEAKKPVTLDLCPD